jgi:hypothetical protein
MSKIVINHPHVVYPVAESNGMSVGEFALFVLICAPIAACLVGIVALAQITGAIR